LLHPLIPLILVPAVEHAHLVDREYYLERVEDGGGALQNLVFLALYEYPDQRMHVLVSLIVFFLVAVEFLAEEAVVVSFKLAFGCLPEQLSLELGEILFLGSIGKLKVIINRGLVKLGQDVGWGSETLLP
jgi:hypothetical protein